MKVIRPFLLMGTASFYALAGCHDDVQQQPRAFMADTLGADSTALRLAVTPTMGNLPFYYARYAGIYRDLGLKLSLRSYGEQLDCDSALLGVSADGASTDLVRLQEYAHRGKPLTAVMAIPEEWKLYASAKLRIKKITSLEGRMVAVARLSAADYYACHALAKAEVNYENVFHPQVNDCALRATMLDHNQVNAAILPEPYATAAALAGHRELFATSPNAPALGCLAFRPAVLRDSVQRQQVNLLVAAYNKAVTDLNAKGKSACSEILLKTYRLSQSAVDSLKLPHFRPAAIPVREAVEMAAEFLKKDERFADYQERKGLLDSCFLSK